MSQTPSSPRISHEEALELAFARRFNIIWDRYLEIPTSLFVGQIDIKMPPLPSIDMYILKDGRVELLRKADQPYSPLALSAHRSILIEKGEFEAVRRYAEATILQSTLAANKAPDKSGAPPRHPRLEAMHRAALSTVEDLFQAPTQENIRKCQRVVGSLVYLFMRDPTAYLILSRLRTHDPYTLQHSVGTAVNAIILARKLSISSESELMEVGMAGLLHDVGKVRVDPKIINKEGPLDDNEWVEMKKHSQHSYDIIKDVPDLSHRTKIAVLDHHEDKTGKGYPAGKQWDKVDLFAKIVSISDVFNALTTNRSYAKARDPFDALKLMKSKLMFKLDEEMFKKLVLIYGGDFSDIPKVA